MDADEKLEVFRLLRDISGHLEKVRDDKRVLRYCLRATREFFDATDGCFARLSHGQPLAEIVYEVPQGRSWNRSLLAAFLRAERPRVPFNHLIVPLRRRGRWWAAFCLRRENGEFERGDGRILEFVADQISILLDRIDQARIHDVRSRLDRKVMEPLRPHDLFYQVLHLLRALTRYDHSSALLMTTDGGTTLQLVAEQIAWTKARSRRIGTKLPFGEALHGQLRGGTPHGFSRGGSGWTEWDGKDASLASLLESPAGSAELDSIPSEATILAAPLVTRDDVIGIIKVAALRPTVLGDYELDLLDQFTPHASVAIHYLQQIESLKNRMLEAERKHAVANVARGVSHDVNNALGSVLPLVQQLRLEAESGEVNGALWAEDLGQIELAVQVCRRIFGNMLGFARYSADKLGQANVRRAVEGTIAILRASFERAGVAVEQHIPDDLPVVRGGQGDLEQVFLNLMSNARDAMPQGGILRVVAAVGPGNVEVVVQDTGIGMPPETLTRIYEPFFTTKATGNGLGLSICRSIVWTMQGDLRVESAQGQGTTARVRLHAVGAADAVAGV
jgi:two-component system, NtrC family, sensor kinase